MKSTALFALVPCVAMAGKVSISALAGYGLPFPGTNIGQNRIDDNRSTSSTTSYEAVYGSYADGFRIGGEIGYALNENVALGLGIRYEASSEYEFTDETKNATYVSGDTKTTSVSGIAFVPSVVYSLSGEVYRPYMRLNGHVGMPTEIIKGSGTGASSGSSYEIECTGGVAWGVGGGLGLEYVLSPAMSLLFEVASESWTWAATEQRYTKFTINGQDALDYVTDSQVKIDYVDSYTVDENPDPNSPRKALRNIQTNSAISMNIGLKFSF